MSETKELPTTYIISTRLAEKDILIPEDLELSKICQTYSDCDIMGEGERAFNDIVKQHPEMIGDAIIVRAYMEQRSDKIALTSAEAPREAAWVLVIIMFIQLIIFLTTLFGIYKLWKDIIHFISNSSDSKIKHLLKAIGTGEVSYSKTKIMGTGVGITIVLLAIAVAAMWVIGNVRIY